MQLVRLTRYGIFEKEKNNIFPCLIETLKIK